MIYVDMKRSCRFFKAVQLDARKPLWLNASRGYTYFVRALDSQLVKIWNAFCGSLKQAFNFKQQDTMDLKMIEQIKKDADPELVSFIKHNFFEKLKKCDHQNLKEHFLSHSLTLMHECLQRLFAAKQGIPEQKDYERVIASMRHAWIDVQEKGKQKLKKAFHKQSMESLLQDVEYYMFNNVTDKGIVMICGQMKQVCESMLTYCQLITFSDVANLPDQLSPSKHFERHKPIIERSISQLLAYEACRLVGRENTANYSAPVATVL